MSDTLRFNFIEAYNNRANQLKLILNEFPDYDLMEYASNNQANPVFETKVILFGRNDLCKFTVKVGKIERGELPTVLVVQPYNLDVFGSGGVMDHMEPFYLQRKVEEQ